MRSTTTTSDTPAASHVASAGTFEQLNALQRQANSLKTTLAVYGFYRQHYEQSSDGLRNLIAQVLAATESELGAYENAVQQFPYGAPDLRSTPARLPTPKDFHAVDAVDGIETLARTRRIVMVNEAHHVAQTRLLTLTLLPRLRALGFTHFAVEGLDERDRDLAVRGYPTNASGIYVREPLYGEIIRTALRLGFIVVPYESSTPNADLAAREEEQARHLVERVFRAHPDARLFVHAGYAHVHKRPEYLDAEPMALHLKRMTGLDPLSIDQTLLRPITSQREYRDYRELLHRFAIHAPTMFLANQGDAPWSLEPSFYDISVVLPPTQQLIVGRPAWLDLHGERTAVAIDLDVQADHLPCVIEARYAAENDKAVPADRTMVEHSDAQALLYLRPGEYRLTASDSNGRIFHQRALHVADVAPARMPAG